MEKSPHRFGAEFYCFPKNINQGISEKCSGKIVVLCVSLDDFIMKMTGNVTFSRYSTKPLPE